MLDRRFLRFYGKKRGARRTGSQRLGNFGEALFYGALLVMGAVGFWLMLSQMILPEWRANRRFAPAECVVESKMIGAKEVDGKRMHRPEVLIRYELDGRTHHIWTYDVNHQLYPYNRAEVEEILQQFEIGKPYRCWYDPSDPQRVVLVRGYSWWLWLLLILPASFFVVGLVGAVRALLQTGTSAERRAAMAHKAAGLDLFDDAEARGARYPGIPGIAHVNDSPGTRLAYRLPVDAASEWMLAGVLAICVFWNGIVAWLLIANIYDHLLGRGQWLMTLLLAPFAVAGVGIIWFAARQSLLLAGTGSTRLEISDHPLLPGQSYELFISHAGNLRRRSLEVSLVCLEKATYRQGTDTRVESVPVYEQRLYQRGALDAGTELGETCQVHVPEGAMHSFQSGHNEIKWQLVVRGEMERWPAYRREFPVIVYPPDPRRSES